MLVPTSRSPTSYWSEDDTKASAVPFKMSGVGSAVQGEGRECSETNLNAARYEGVPMGAVEGSGQLGVE